MTAFVTDEAQVRLRSVSVDGPVDRIVLLSDGLERLALEFGTGFVYQPFFDRMSAPIASDSSVGHARHLSFSLTDYLDGASVCERTDDDKSLIVAVRR